MCIVIPLHSKFVVGHKNGTSLKCYKIFWFALSITGSFEYLILYAIRSYSLKLADTLADLCVECSDRMFLYAIRSYSLKLADTLADLCVECSDRSPVTVQTKVSQCS